MQTSSQVQKDIRITHLNHWLKNLINKYIHYKSNVLSTFSGLEPVLTYALDIGTAKSCTNLVHSHPSHILCFTPCVKARKHFQGVLPCLVMMYHQTNLDYNYFCIFLYFWRYSRNDCGFDFEHSKVIFLNDTLADDDESPYYIWPIRDIVRENIHWSSEPSLWPWPWIQQSNLFTRHSSLWTCTVKLSRSPKNQQFRTYSHDFIIWTQIQLLWSWPRR